jgi:transcriptional regulator with XRE-family HTH domain
MVPCMASRHPERYRQLLVLLRKARLASGLTQVRVAEILGTDQKYISRVETGERRLDPLELQELAELYGRPVSYFFE